jgi:hypothetical protein
MMMMMMMIMRTMMTIMIASEAVNDTASSCKGARGHLRKNRRHHDC